MKLPVFNSILFWFCTTLFIFAQKTTLRGTLYDRYGKPLQGVEIYNKSLYDSFFSEANGEFEITIAPKVENTLVFFLSGYKTIEVIVTANSKDLTISMEELSTQLSEVVIIKEKEKQFALNKLKDVEETAIYAGKKTEVITLDKVAANKATNNARQVYSQVAGLTINENSDGGLQLSVGGRGLNPNRTANFNTRQNDYDISADVLGYPESYYATPTEALEEIQIVRGAASLQYGTQFGGMINFKIKKPTTKPFEIVTRNTLGSFDLFTNFTSISGTHQKFSYYAFSNYKQGKGFRPHSKFDSNAFFTQLNYQFTKNTSVHLDYTHFGYLAQQPGGLTDVMFAQDPTQSNRSRNWFQVGWNLFALRFKHHFTNEADFSLQLFGLDASRDALGYRSNRVSNPDTPGTVRDLIKGKFVNWGAEARYLKKYSFFNQKNVFLVGAKYYQAKNKGLQGPGSSDSEANFDLATEQFPLYGSQSDYKYPNLNWALFGEHIFKIGPSFSITPGFRYENIQTQAIGYYRRINLDLAGNVLLDVKEEEDIVKKRNFFLLGLGLSYKMKNGLEWYANVSQNYRSVTFNDIRTTNPSAAIAPDITDEKGYTSDIGIRGKFRDFLSFDTNVFALYYDQKIGEYLTLVPTSASPVRYRDNVGTGLTYGVETLVDWNITKSFFRDYEHFIWNVFSNIALTDSQYLESEIRGIKGNKVEFVPFYNLKMGTTAGYKNWLGSIQFSYVSSQFTDAENHPTDPTDNTYGIYGEIPTFYVVDFSTSYKWNHFKLEAGINNLLNQSYFTRRATGYPGPGIIPSEPRMFYTTLEIRF